jgi:hypothetical protein
MPRTVHKARQMNVNRKPPHMNLAPFITAITMSALIPTAVLGESQYTIDDVRKAWEARQARVKTAEFTWEVTEFIAAETRAAPPSGKEPPKFLPQKDTTIKRTCSVALSGKMMCYAYQGQTFNPSHGGVTVADYVSVFNGEVSSNFFDHPVPPEGMQYIRSGAIREKAVHYDFDNLFLSPVLMSCRPCDTDTGGIDLSRYEISAKLGTIEGETCLVLQVKAPEPTRGIFGDLAFWVAPDQAFAVRRIVCRRKNAPPFYSVDIHLTCHDEGEWMPQGWKYLDTGGRGGAIQTQLTAVVTECKINQAIPVSRFEFDFPPDTAVVDHRTGSRYIVRDTGETREITDAELQRGAGYKDLLATESGTALQNTSSSPDGRQTVWFGWPLYVICALFAAGLVAVVVWTRYRARS